MQGCSDSGRQNGAYGISAICALAVPKKAAYVQGVGRGGLSPCTRVSSLWKNSCCCGHDLPESLHKEEVLPGFSSEAEILARAFEWCIVSIVYAGAQ